MAIKPFSHLDYALRRFTRKDDISLWDVRDCIENIKRDLKFVETLGWDHEIWNDGPFKLDVTPHDVGNGLGWLEGLRLEETIRYPLHCNVEELRNAINHLEGMVEYYECSGIVPGECLDDTEAEIKDLYRMLNRRLKEEGIDEDDDLVEALAHEAKQQQEITESDVPF